MSVLLAGGQMPEAEAAEGYRVWWPPTWPMRFWRRAMDVLAGFSEAELEDVRMTHQTNYNHRKDELRTRKRGDYSRCGYEPIPGIIGSGGCCLETVASSA